MSSMRQRINPKAPSRRRLSAAAAAAASWEIKSDSSITSDNEAESPSVNNDVSGLSIPMYNPLHYPSQQQLPPLQSQQQYLQTASPVSFPLSLQHHQYQFQQHYEDDPVRHKMIGSKPHLSTSPHSFNGLKSSDLPSLTPAFIPDANYHDFQRTGRPEFHNRAKHSPLVPFSKLCCAKVCAGFSFVGVGFLLFVGLIFDRQPLYIPGALPKHVQYVEGGTQRTQVVFSIYPSMRLLPASNAYKAAWLYFFTGCFCLAYIHNLFSMFYVRKGYTDIPDTDSTVPTFHVSRSLSSHPPGGSGSGDLLLPTNHRPVGSPGRRGRHLTSYFARGSMPDRMVESIRSLYNRMWIYAVSAWPSFQDHRRTRRREPGPKEV